MLGARTLVRVLPCSWRPARILSGPLLGQGMPVAGRRCEPLVMHISESASTSASAGQKAAEGDMAMTDDEAGSDREGEDVSEGLSLPPRTVPDHHLVFRMRAYRGGDTAFRYPNFSGLHPLESKVELFVSLEQLQLDKRVEDRLLILVGPRYDKRKGIIKLVSDRFPSRIDNKRYLVHLLENLLAEARKHHIDDDDDDDDDDDEDEDEDEDDEDKA